MYVNTYINMYIYTYVYKYISIYIHKYVYTYIYAYVCVIYIHTHIQRKRETEDIRLMILDEIRRLD